MAADGRRGGAEHVCADAYQAALALHSLVEGEEEIFEGLERLLGRILAVSRGAVLWEGVCLEERREANIGE